jgi:hypothetical protein
MVHAAAGKGGPHAPADAAVAKVNMAIKARHTALLDISAGGSLDVPQG